MSAQTLAMATKVLDHGTAGQKNNAWCGLIGDEKQQWMTMVYLNAFKCIDASVHVHVHVYLHLL